MPNDNSIQLMGSNCTIQLQQNNSLMSQNVEKKYQEFLSKYNFKISGQKSPKYTITIKKVQYHFNYSFA